MRNIAKVWHSKAWLYKVRVAIHSKGEAKSGIIKWRKGVAMLCGGVAQ